MDLRCGLLLIEVEVAEVWPTAAVGLHSDGTFWDVRITVDVVLVCLASSA